MDRLTSNALVICDGLVVVLFQGSQIGHLEEVLVRETELKSSLVHYVPAGS